MKLYYNLVLLYGGGCSGYVGGCETLPLGGVEPSLRYHAAAAVQLTSPRHPGKGQYLAGSLTGAVASQMVTEALTKVG